MYLASLASIGNFIFIVLLNVFILNILSHCVHTLLKFLQFNDLCFCVIKFILYNLPCCIYNFSFHFYFFKLFQRCPHVKKKFLIKHQKFIFLLLLLLLLLFPEQRYCVEIHLVLFILYYFIFFRLLVCLFVYMFVPQEEFLININLNIMERKQVRWNIIKKFI